MRVPALVLALSAALTPSFAVAITPARADDVHLVPLSMHGRYPSTTVLLGDHPEPLRFVVDSGSSATLVDSARARALGLVREDGEIASATGASDAGAVLQRLEITQWKIGSMTLRAGAMQTDLSRIGGTGGKPIDGIVGNDITSRYDSRFDFKAWELQLHPAGKLARDANCVVNAMPQRPHVLRNFGFVPMQIGTPAVEVVAIIDTGAAQSVLNAAAAEALGLRTDGTDARVRESATGTRGLGGQAATRTWLYTTPGMRMGEWRRDAMDVRISALPVFKVLGLEEKPALVLGIDALQGSQLDILARAERVCLRRE